MSTNTTDVQTELTPELRAQLIDAVNTYLILCEERNLAAAKEYLGRRRRHDFSMGAPLHRSGIDGR